MKVMVRAGGERRSMTHPHTVRPTEELESFMKGVNHRLWVLKHFPEEFTPGDAEELWKLIKEAVHIGVGMYEDAPEQVKQILKPIKALYDEHLINAGKASQN